MIPIRTSHDSCPAGVRQSIPYFSIFKFINEDIYDRKRNEKNSEFIKGFALNYRSKKKSIQELYNYLEKYGTIL